MRLTSFAIRVMEKDEKWGQKNSRVDFCYLVSIWAPNADEDALRMMMDWNHWVGSTHAIFNEIYDRQSAFNRSFSSMIVSILGRTPCRMQFNLGTYHAEFDEGHLKWDLASAEAEVEANMAILTDAHQPLHRAENKLRWIFQLCWTRLKNVIVSSTLYLVFDSKS